MWKILRFYGSRSCSNDPTGKIANIITEMSEKVLNVSQELTAKQADAEQRVQIAVTLFYKFIETILESEKKIGADISVRLFENCSFTVSSAIFKLKFKCVTYFFAESSPERLVLRMYVRLLFRNRPLFVWKFETFPLDFGYPQNRSTSVR